MLNSFVWEFMLNSWFSNFIIQHENMVRNKKYSVYAQLTLSDDFFFVWTEERLGDFFLVPFSSKEKMIFILNHRAC